jgi:hypothetical protein
MPFFMVKLFTFLEVAVTSVTPDVMFAMANEVY